MRICDKCIHDKVCLLSKSRASCELFDEYRPRGEWIDVNGDGSIMKCSVCGDKVCCKNNNFCPNCGLPMNEKALEIIRKRAGEAE